MDATAQELTVRFRQLTNELAVTREEHRRNLMLNLELVADLDHLRAALEDRVRERTAELQSSNRLLEDEVRQRRKVQAELSEAMDRAQAANRAKSEFLANMSHEIRTPMNGIIGMVSLLAETELSAEQRRYLETVQTSTHYLLGIINDILDYSKIEAGKLEVVDEVFDVHETVESVVSMLAPRAKEKAVTLACVIAPEVPALVNGDAGRVRQVLTNLVGNAVKFTQAGEIAIRLSCAEGGRLSFSVRDTGIGIPEELQGQLFQPFTQADSSASRKFGGTGLGLAISKQLAGLMGGEIGLRSPPEPGARGSLFWFTVRARAAADRRASGQRSAERPAAAGPVESRFVGVRVLLAEDNGVNRQVAVAMLGRLGMVVDVAFNGVEAVRAAESKPYDLVLMDCQMPEMDGYEATRRIRHLEGAEPVIVGNRSVPIVAMTANAMKGDRDKCLAAGMDDYIAKPVERPALLQTLARVLGKAAPGPAGAAPGPGPGPSVEAGGRAQPVFDRKGALEKLGGDEQLFAQVTELFAGELGAMVARIRQAILHDNATDTLFHAHSLKGAASRIGALALRDVGEQIEQAARHGETAPLRERLGELQQAHRAFLDALTLASEGRGPSPATGQAAGPGITREA